MLQRIPAPLTGRVLALVQSLAWAGIPLGGLVGGLLTEAVGVTTALLICGAAYLVVIAAPASQPGWRAMDTRLEPPVTATIRSASARELDRR